MKIIVRDSLFWALLLPNFIPYCYYEVINMDNDNALKIVESLQDTVEQMRIDDIEDAPESAFENFQCNCCGEEKMLAGSMIYDEYQLCNECVLVAETAFALKKIENIQELVESMEDKRFENVYNTIFEQKGNINN